MKPTILPPHGRDLHIAGLAKMLATIFPGKPVRVTVEIAQPDKTPAQNRYLWAVPYTMLSEVTGYDKDELHEWACGAMWGWKDRKCPRSPRNDEGVESVPVRTTTRDADGQPNKCSAEEMGQLWARVQRLGASFGLVIPDPDPQWWKEKAA